MTSKNITYQYIQDAAKFRLKLQPWITDHHFINNGGIIYYAVDTDVVKFFSQPQEKIDYANIFTQDSDSTREILAWSLGQFIFLNLTQEEPLLIIPPHHLEIERVINGIAWDADREREEAIAFFPQLEEVLHSYRKTKDIDILIKLFKHKPLALINFAFGGEEGFTAELNRITKLLIDIRILHIDRYVDKKGNKSAVLPCLQDDINEKDYKILNKFSNEWERRLKKTKSKVRSEERINDDAEMLARLEWINNEFQDEKKRIVLISGDQALFKAADEYLPDSRNSFAENFIRHPITFLASPDFLSYISNQRNGFSKQEDNNSIFRLGLINWFNVFLAQYEPNSDGYCDRLIELINSKSLKQQQAIANNYLTNKKREKNLQELIREWQEFVRLTGLFCGVTRGNNKLVLKEIGKKNFSELREQITCRAEAVWEKFLQSAAEVGFWSTNAFERKRKGDAARNLPLRGIPAPRFTLKPVCDYIKELCLTLQHGPILNEKNSISFKDINQTDVSGYSAFFLYALAFGAAGRWGVSRTLAKHAYDIANSLSTEKQLPAHLEPITGNEAAYLLSWSIRHSVKSVEKLREALSFLNQAVERKAAAVGGDGSDIRYDSEYIAIYMTAHFFRVFCKQTFSYKIPTLSDCHDTIMKLFTKLNQDVHEEEHIRRTVKKQLFVYIFSSFLLRKFKEELEVPEQHQKDVYSLISDFKQLLDGEEPPVRTCFTQPVYYAVCALFHDNIDIRNECQSQAFSTWKAKEMYIKRCSVMPYDEELYKFLINLACKASVDN